VKGVIACCLKDLIVSLRGTEMWEKCLQDAGVDKKASFLPVSDVPDAQMMSVVGAVCKNMGLTVEQAADAFGDYWVNVYSQKMYKHFFARHKTARDFLLAMDQVHVVMTDSMKNAHPPRFTYEWKDGKTLIMHYASGRGLIDFLAGLAKGVGKYYKEQLQISKIGSDQVKIVFA
jgi:hypothetical protein